MNDYLGGPSATWKGDLLAPMSGRIFSFYQNPPQWNYSLWAGFFLTNSASHRSLSLFSVLSSRVLSVELSEVEKGAAEGKAENRIRNTVVQQLRLSSSSWEISVLTRRLHGGGGGGGGAGGRREEEEDEEGQGEARSRRRRCGASYHVASGAFGDAFGTPPSIPCHSDSVQIRRRKKVWTKSSGLTGVRVILKSPLHPRERQKPSLKKKENESIRISSSTAKLFLGKLSNDVMCSVNVDFWPLSARGISSFRYTRYGNLRNSNRYSISRKR